MKKIIALVLCVIIALSAAISVSAEVDLTLDFNKRYTDIYEHDEIDDPYLDTQRNSREAQQKRNIYVVVLLILLIIAIAVFVYTLKKVPTEEQLTEKNKERRIKRKSDSGDEE